MQARGVLADVVTCCSLINALERGGQWQLAEQLFVQMCAASWQAHGVNSPLYRIMEIAAAPCPPQDAGSAPSEQSLGLSHAQSQSWEHSDSALVMCESSLVATSPQRSNPLTSAMAMYTAPMLFPLARTLSPLPASPATPAGRSLDGKLSSSFPKYSSGSPHDQIGSPQPDRPFVSTPSKQLSVSSQDSGSNTQMYRNASSQYSLFSRDPADSIGREAYSIVMQTPLSKSQGPDVHPVSSSSNSSSRWVSKGMNRPVMHTPPYRHPSAEFRPAGSSSSDYTPKNAQAHSSPETVIPKATHGAGKNSPEHALLSASSTASGQIGRAESSELLRSFTNMRVGSASQSIQRALFPAEALRLQNSSGLIGSSQIAIGLRHQGSFTQGSESGVLRQQGSFGGGHSPDESSGATVRRIQEAAVDRQELLSLTPTTTPVGGSRGQAPVLRHMNVSQIAPNRVCCNALLAAYARAKPTCWQKVIRWQCCCTTAALMAMLFVHVHPMKHFGPPKKHCGAPEELKAVF